MSADAAQRDAPFFIVGAPRSGTTMLRLMLNAHPRLCVPPESHFIADLDGRFRGRPFDRGRAWEALRRHERFREWGLGEEEALAGVEARGWADLHRAVFAAYARREGKPRWGDKTPQYARRLTLIHELFPEAFVIHIVRDPRDVACSLLGMPWFEGGAYDAAEHWRAHVHKARRDGARFGERYIEVRYEDLVRRADSELERICAALGESPDAAMLDFQNTAERAIPDHRREWHQRTMRPVDESAIGRWRSELSAGDVALVEHVAGPLLRACGYEPSGRGRLRAAIRAWAARARRAMPGTGRGATA